MAHDRYHPLWVMSLPRLTFITTINTATMHSAIYAISTLWKSRHKAHTLCYLSALDWSRNNNWLIENYISSDTFNSKISGLCCAVCSFDTKNLLNYIRISVPGMLSLWIFEYLMSKWFCVFSHIFLLHWPCSFS